jgi:hypothetical protein
MTPTTAMTTTAMTTLMIVPVFFGFPVGAGGGGVG